nr:type II 3-dehydroquinate dehydratase [Opacimonas viscosa]
MILNGPNLNLLGTREPEIYGSQTLDDVMQVCVKLGAELGHNVTYLQTNAEYALIDAVQAAQADIDFIIINPAAFTHTSVALRDALLGVAIPFIEIHISNVHARESFRQHSYLSDVAQGVIVGCGTYGYQLALQSADQYLSSLS